MSMNIQVMATIPSTIIVNGKSKVETIIEHFECIQTPTIITEKILKSDDKYNTYRDFVLKNSEDIEVFIYDDQDIFEEREPVDIQFVNSGKEHIDSLLGFLEYHDGWEIIWYQI